MLEIDDLVEAFSEQPFQETIQEKLDKISCFLNEFINNQKYIKDPRILGTLKIVSRIKDKESFKEKVNRKNYLSEWEIDSTDKKDIQDVICKNLPDLIGFKINCYFKNQEENIYLTLIRYLEEKNCFEIEKSVNKVQKNGHLIFKVACKYKEDSKIFSFEVQVKAQLNDIWGEVEHSIIYKGKAYDPKYRENLKYNIIEGIYTILDGTDKQLSELYSFNTSIEEMKKELFYEYSKPIIQESNIILGEYYKIFFKLIYFINNSKNLIDTYLGKKLLSQSYTKEKLQYDGKDFIEIEKYKSNIDKNKWKMFCSIASVLYEYESNDILLKYIINEIKNVAEGNDKDDIFDSTQGISEEEVFNAVMRSLACVTKNNIEIKEEQTLC